MFVTLAVLVLLLGGGTLFINSAVFGSLPVEESVKRNEKSPNYKDGKFQNLLPTSTSMSLGNLYKSITEMMSAKDKAPINDLPSVITDLKGLKEDGGVLVWFGHSSYLLKIKGRTILVDPVFSGGASPVSGFAKAFKGADVYSVKDMPEVIDVLVLTHDHYDHLDYKTILELKGRVKKIVCPLGVAAHLIRWGFDNTIIIELDWWEEVKPNAEVKFTALPARHFSGRGFTQFKSLWCSYMLDVDSTRIYLGGDSGYGNHFKAIGEKFPNIDLAILECGQYNEKWALIHMFPEQVLQASKDLGVKKLWPVHWGKFALGIHAWYEPINRLTAANDGSVTIATPMIGEPMYLDRELPNKVWWKYDIANQPQK
jgi:L-ascorbate metabolism protein UlaG (beta-lactamase superfamily)